MAPSSPIIAPFPSFDWRNSMLSEDWAICLEAWIALTRFYLQQEQAAFRKATSVEPSLEDFLLSFCQEISNAQSKDTLVESASWKTLRKHVFLLAHRLLSDPKAPTPQLLDWSFLADLSAVFFRSTSLRKLLDLLWIQSRAKLEDDLGTLKVSLTKRLEAADRDESELGKTLSRLDPLLAASPEAARLFMVGSDFLDALSTAHQMASPALRRRVIATAYLSLNSLLEGPKPNLSLLVDHLYSLKSQEVKNSSPVNAQSTLLSDLIQSTPFLSHLQDRSRGPEAARARPLIESLEKIKHAPGSRPKRLIRRKIIKGRMQANDDMNGEGYGHEAGGEMHVHRLSLISQVQDLFPDLGAGFIAKLLDEYGEDVEQVTAHLLDDSLPPHLRNADRSQTLSKPPKPARGPLLPAAPRQSRTAPPASRRNVFDDDELDTLTVPTSRLHIGRRNPDQTADALLQDHHKTPSAKSAILSALAAFDTDDDERDDTYDASDVGDTVDRAPPTAPDEADADLRVNEEALYAAWRTSPEAFNRDAATRRSQTRAKLRSDTAMTDEALEGWGLMLGRDPRKMRALEAKYGMLAGGGSGGARQTQLQRTAWRDGGDSVTQDSEDTDRGGDDSGRGGARGRGGRGRGRGGRGGGVGQAGSAAASASDGPSSNNRRRNEANKGSRANHNRRDQRAKKMARGGGGVMGA